MLSSNFYIINLHVCIPATCLYPVTSRYDEPVNLVLVVLYTKWLFVRGVHKSGCLWRTRCALLAQKWLAICGVHGVHKNRYLFLPCECNAGLELT